MKQSELFSIFVTCPLGLQYALERELGLLGANSLKATPAGVSAEVDQQNLYQVLLWSRIANRVILQITKGKINEADDVYDLAMKIMWDSYFSETNSISVDFIGTNNIINNSTFGALRIKDAVVDQFRQDTGVRPSVDRNQADIRISARLHKDYLSIGIDLSGESLHRRGYRTAMGSAPLKENLAAGLLMLTGWPEKFEVDASFVDPMCGSGTLLIEAAMLVTCKAPGLDREQWGFSAWKTHDEQLWQNVKDLANEAFEKGKAKYRGRIVGFDQDPTVISSAWSNIKLAGFETIIHVEKKSLDSFALFEKMESGLVLTNPPYGERLGEVQALKGLYALLGEQFEAHLLNWQAAVFTGNIDLGRSVAWRSHKQYKLYNGAIDSHLLLFNLEQNNRFKEVWQSPDIKIHSPSFWKVSHSERAKMFANRIKKNYKAISKWANKNKIECYRLYDADMPEFSIAIDIYKDEKQRVWMHVQEYAAPKSVDAIASIERLREALAVLSGHSIDEEDTGLVDALGVSAERIILKRRAIQKGSSQYEKAADSNEYLLVNENNAKFQVNLKDYLDTGLFLDHRIMRRWVRDHAQGKRFLNLFCYTASVSVNAALGGSRSSLSIDMSKTYLNWANENYIANNMDLSKHKLSQLDCLEWLKSKQPIEPFDLIFLDPPSFSNSKKMQGVLDIQRDHSELIDLSMTKLTKNGQLIFSNNLRKFKLDDALNTRYKITNFTKQSIDKDFERNQKIHQCWIIENQNS